jgi:transposase-like protein
MASPLFVERGDAIRIALAEGLSVPDAAHEHDVSPRTVSRWLSRGRSDPAGPYGDFAARVDGARAERHLAPRDELPLDADELRLLVARGGPPGKHQGDGAGRQAPGRGRGGEGG